MKIRLAIVKEIKGNPSQKFSLEHLNPKFWGTPLPLTLQQGCVLLDSVGQRACPSYYRRYKCWNAFYEHLQTPERSSGDKVGAQFKVPGLGLTTIVILIARFPYGSSSLVISSTLSPLLQLTQGSLTLLRPCTSLPYSMCPLSRLSHPCTGTNYKRISSNGRRGRAARWDKRRVNHLHY